MQDGRHRPSRGAGRAGGGLPITTHILQAFVTEPMKPFLRPALALLQPLGYCHQTLRGEFVGGTELPRSDEPISLNATFGQLVDMATKFVRMMPVLAGLRVVRHWAGLDTQTPDIAPLLGPVPEAEGLVLNCGHVYGFMAAPAAGAAVAHYIRDGKLPRIATPFDVRRFGEGREIREDALVVAASEDGGTARSGRPPTRARRAPTSFAACSSAGA